MDNYEVKYRLDYSNIVNDNFVLEILQKSDTTFTVEQLQGIVVFTKGSVDDVFKSIRPTSLTINLEASRNLPLEDFESFNEFDFKIKFYRNELQIFEGWLNPDGYFQDWVNDKWEISMTAVDGLGTLKNLAFSDFEKGEVKAFQVGSEWVNNQTELQLRLIAGSWINEGFILGSELEILDVFNIGRYSVTFITPQFLTLVRISGEEQYISGGWTTTLRYNQFTYAPREFNYLYAALERLDYSLPFVLADDINVELGVNPEWVDVKKRIIDRDVFINNNGAFQNCEIVLNDILQKYNLTITQENIEGRLVWYIARVIYAAYGVEQRINRQYNTSIQATDGIAEILLEQFNFANGNPKERVVYSDINSSEGDVIHCNENQQITFKPALQNFRFESKWKGLRVFLGDISQDWEEIPPLPSYPTASFPWGIVDDYILMYQVYTPDVVNTAWFKSKNIKPPKPVEQGVNIFVDWYVDYKFVNPAVGIPMPVKFKITLSYTTDTTTLFYNSSTNEWTVSPVFIEFNGEWPTPGVQFVGVLEGTTEVNTPPGGQSLTGQYQIEVYSPEGDNEGYHEVRINNVIFEFVINQFGLGKNHDSTQPQKRSTFLNNPVTVINTNEPNAFFQNNLYRLASAPEQITGLVPMNEWKATNTPTFADLLELTGRERIRVKANPQKIFTGDVFGYVPYSSVIKYDGINGNFVPLSYRYNTAENITQIEASQIFNVDVEIDHEKKFTFENERNVLIKEI